jgi:hypothetical protein
MYYAAENIGYVSAELAWQRRKEAARISKDIATLSPHFRTLTPRTHLTSDLGLETFDRGQGRERNREGPGNLRCGPRPAV